MLDRPAASKRVLIVAPYWLDPQHLGSYRVDRYVRWLSAEGVSITMVAGGNDEGVKVEKWGTLITIRDPLGIYRAPKIDSTAATTTPARASWLRKLAYFLLNPDPGILWAWRAMRHPLVKKHSRECGLVLSSSFPESAHVAAEYLSKHIGAELIADLRDGWLDEPMKPFLETSRFRRWREGRLERRILRRASTIFVTSENWRKLLVKRLPFTSDKTVVLTNASPMIPTGALRDQTKPQQPFTLLYAGRIFSSRAERKLDHLFAPLLAGLKNSTRAGRLLFLGNLSGPEVHGIREWEEKLKEVDWTIEMRQAVSRDVALAHMRDADGLLMLSSSYASIPAKLFDYAAAGRPVLALAPMDSAVGALENRIEQLFVLDYANRNAATSVVPDFMETCLSSKQFDIPLEFTEAHQRTIFMSAMAKSGKANLKFQNPSME